MLNITACPNSQQQPDEPTEAGRNYVITAHDEMAPMSPPMLLPYLYNGQHQEQHGGSAQHTLIPHNLERRDGQVGHKKVFKSNLRGLNALAAAGMPTKAAWRP